MVDEILIAAAAASFVIIALENFVSLRWFRGVAALALSFGAVWVLLRDLPLDELIVTALAAAFSALLMLVIADRLASPPPTVVRRQR